VFDSEGSALGTGLGLSASVEHRWFRGSLEKPERTTGQPKRPGLYQRTLKGALFSDEPEAAA